MPRSNEFVAACRKLFKPGISQDGRSEQSLDMAFGFGVNPMIEQVEQMKELVSYQRLPVETAISHIADIIGAGQTQLFKWRAKEFLKSGAKLSTQKARSLVQTFLPRLKRGMSI